MCLSTKIAKLPIPAIDGRALGIDFEVPTILKKFLGILFVALGILKEFLGNSLHRVPVKKQRNVQPKPRN